MRSTFCHMPSWQYISSCGSVGENSRWFDPVGRVQKHLDGSGLLAVRPRLQPDGEQHHGNARGQPALHHRALVVGLHIGPAQRGSSRLTGGLTAAGAPAAEAPGAACARVPPAPTPLPNPPAGAARNAFGALGSPPGQSASLYVPAPSVSSAFTLEMLTRGGRSISLVTAPVLVSALYTALRARHRVHAREEDAVGLVAHNDGARSAAESATAASRACLSARPPCIHGERAQGGASGSAPASASSSWPGRARECRPASCTPSACGRA